MSKIFFCISLIYSFFSMSLLYADPLLVVVLMVKDEATAIVPTLQPFVDAGIDAYSILDTGSTDDTVTITKNFFENNHIKHGYIDQQAFIDFATSRNFALQCAEKNFPDADFFLMIDADWYMQNVHDLLKFCLMQRNASDPTYLVRIANENSEFYVDRLIRPGRGVQFIGTVHEGLNVVATTKAPYNAFFVWGWSEYSIQKSKKRWVRDKDLLEEELKKKPGNPRILFYLAQTYACLGEWDKACEYYHKRCTVNGWDEENYMARYQLAEAYTAQNQWDKALCYYLEAYAMRSTRAEPLIKIAEYYLEHNNFAASFLFAKAALEIPYPTTDSLMVEKKLYDYVRYDIMGRCAWYVGQFDTGRTAVLQALTVKPDAPHLIKNLSFYQPSKNINNK
jgi:tetratricopeptide (TPR) repeat protein